jgi:competence protein ComEA
MARSHRATARLQRIRNQWAPVASTPQPPPRLRFGPWSPRAGRGLALMLTGAVLLAGWWWWSGRPGEIVLAADVSEPGIVLDVVDQPVVVHVLGAVRRPGLFELPPGSRVADAIEAAGGAEDAEALASVNLARILVDGEQVHLNPDGAPEPGSPGDGLISLNQASASEFQALPGVGPVLAERIVAWRTTNGPFRSIDELGEVSGIGNAILEQVRPLLRL